MNKSEALQWCVDCLNWWPSVDDLARLYNCENKVPDGWWFENNMTQELVMCSGDKLSPKTPSEYITKYEWEAATGQQPHSDSESVFLDGPSYTPPKRKAVFIAGAYDGTDPTMVSDYADAALSVRDNLDDIINPAMLAPGQSKAFYLAVSMAALQFADEVLVVHVDGAEPYIESAKAMGKKVSYFTKG